MAEETVYSRTARKALEATGGREALAQALERSPGEIEDWLAGRQVPPDTIFLRLLEIVSRRR